MSRNTPFPRFDLVYLKLRDEFQHNERRKQFVASVIATVLALTLIGIAYAAEDVRPNATATEAGGSCTTANAHTTLDDDIESPAGDLCTADSDVADHDIRLNFATPSTAPGTGADAQTFKVLAINSKTAGNGVAQLALSVYCNGALVSAGTNQNLGDTLSTISRTWTFDTGSCAADGSDVELLLDCTAADNGGANNDTSCTYDAVEWVAQATAAPTVSTDAASSVTSFSAVLNGNITDTGGDSPSVRGFAWGTDSTLSNGDTSTTTDTAGAPFGTGAFTQTVSGLIAGRTYYFRAYATNSAGTGFDATSPILSFTTSAADTTLARRMRLFEGFTIKLLNGRIILHQQ